jgi:hypothetical protein
VRPRSFADPTMPNPISSRVYTSETRVAFLRVRWRFAFSYTSRAATSARVHRVTVTADSGWDARQGVEGPSVHSA